MLGLTVEIRGDTKDLDAALGKSKGGVAGFGGDMAGTALKILPVAAAAAGAAIALKSMADGAAEDAAQAAKLQAAIAAGQELAFTDTQTRDALQSLVTTTGDLTEAQTLLATAQDVARFAGVDLATAADAVAKANEGQDGALRKLLPGLEQGATSTDTLANAQRLAAGQAEAYSKTTAAGMAKAEDAVGELGETVGAARLPALDAILPAFIPVIKTLGQLVTTILPLIIPLLKLVGVALGIVSKALTVVVEWLIKLVDWLKKGMDWLGDLLSKIGPLKDLGNLVGGIVGGLGASAASVSPTTRGARAGGGGGTGGVVINITATGDSLATEQAVLRALRRTTRLNAGAVPAWSS